jgi:hypothetical protein
MEASFTIWNCNTCPLPTYIKSNGLPAAIYSKQISSIETLTTFYAGEQKDRS